MTTIAFTAIAYVRGGRTEIEDDDWGAVEATIEVDPASFDPDPTASLDWFSHLVVVFHFDRVAEGAVQRGARRPRGNSDWPMVGIPAQRAKARPNRIGVSTCEILGVDGLRIRVRGLDAIDGTPVLDIKPYMGGFEPRSEVREPGWARELMNGYW